MCQALHRCVEEAGVSVILHRESYRGIGVGCLSEHQFVGSKVVHFFKRAGITTLFWVKSGLRGLRRFVRLLILFLAQVAVIIKRVISREVCAFEATFLEMAKRSFSFLELLELVEFSHPLFIKLES